MDSDRTVFAQGGALSIKPLPRIVRLVEDTGPVDSAWLADVIAHGRPR